MMESATDHLFLYIGAVFILLVIRVTHLVVNDPLKHVPGPWHSRFSSIGSFIADVQKRRLKYIQCLHRKYGPVVRTGPREVSFSEQKDFKDIHRMGSGFTKSEFYDGQDLTLGEHPSLFSIRDVKTHAARRKLFARVMSARHMRDNWQSMTDGRVKLMVERLREEASRDGQVDAAKWFRLLAGDVVSHLSFGESFKNLEKGGLVPYMEAVELLPMILFAAGVFQPWMFRYIRMLPLSERWRRVFNANELIKARGLEAVENSRVDTGIGSKANIFSAALEETEKDDGNLTDDQIVSEASAFIAAGTDTTSLSLFLMVWAILQRPDLQRKLEEEVASVDTLDDEMLERLPILNACMYEAFRVYGVASGPLPRNVSATGATINNTYLPAGTTVTVPAYLVQCDPRVFQNPEEFDYTRYLPENPDYHANMDRVGNFGGGARVCIGIHLAKMEIRKAITHFFRECKGVRLASKLQGVPIEFDSMGLMLVPKQATLDVVLDGW